MGAVKGKILEKESNQENDVLNEIFGLSGRMRAEAYKGEKTAYPTITHQSMIGYLYTEISVYLRAKDEKSKVILSPFAVYLKEDNHYLEPDIAVVCDEGKLDEEGCHGAPDWVIEVVSSVSRGMDYGCKLGAYIDAGVREYWIVDQEKKVIVTYYLEQPDLPVIHHFGDIVKPEIYQDFVIDSSQLEKIQYKKAAAGTGGREKEKVFGMLVSAVKKALSTEDCHTEVSDTLLESVVRSELKLIKEQWEENPADEEVLKKRGESEKYQKSLETLEEYTPETMKSVDEIKGYINKHFSELVLSKNKGQIMKTVMAALKGRVDSRMVNEAVAELCR